MTAMEINPGVSAEEISLRDACRALDAAADALRWLLAFEEPPAERAAVRCAQVEHFVQHAEQALARAPASAQTVRFKLGLQRLFMRSDPTGRKPAQFHRWARRNLVRIERSKRALWGVLGRWRK